MTPLSCSSTWLISIHALREEGDYFAIHSPGEVEQFLSTPSARRATVVPCMILTAKGHFYPRPPRGGRHFCSGSCLGLDYFYPRPPRGGRLLPKRQSLKSRAISIHALREEGDGPWLQRQGAPGNFYPRPPRGGRLPGGFSFAREKKFLSTPSARRATAVKEKLDDRADFYPRPPRGGRRSMIRSTLMSLYFYPRPPRGGRQISFSISSGISIFLSTPSARRATRQLSNAQEQSSEISIHALREEGDSKNRDKISIFKQIIQHSARI